MCALLAAFAVACTASGDNADDSRADDRGRSNQGTSDDNRADDTGRSAQGTSDDSRADDTGRNNQGTSDDGRGDDTGWSTRGSSDDRRADGAAADGAALDDASSFEGQIGGSLRVLVAASLMPVAEALADAFGSAHPGVDVAISGAGSSTLREQVLAGAPADVFIPADPAHLDAVRAEVGLIGEPVVVARNSLVLAVPEGNPAGVASLADLGRPELLIGLCAPEVPCGALARAGLAAAGIEPRPDTDEPNVRALATKLAAGELDAAVVYASDAHVTTDESADARGAGAAITSLGWPTGTAPQASYAAAALADAPNDAAARQFVAFLLTEPARAAFLRHGFMAP